MNHIQCGKESMQTAYSHVINSLHTISEKLCRLGSLLCNGYICCTGGTNRDHSFSFFSFVAFVPDESRYVPDESRFVPDESRQSSLTPLRRKKMSTDAISIRIHTMITSSCLLPAPSRCSSSVMVTNWRPKVTPSSAPRLHIVE